MEGEKEVTLTAEVLLGADLLEDNHDYLVDGLRSLGVAPTVKRVLRHRGINDIPPWLVLVALPLQPFLTTLIEKLAGDAYPRLKSLVVGLFRRQAEAEGEARVLVLQDSVSGVQVLLEPDLPAESYERLHRIDLSTLGQGPLRYDRTAREWRSPVDEPAPQGARSR